MIDAFVVVGFVAVVPLAFASNTWRWPALGPLLILSFFAPEGALAGLLVLPAVVLAADLCLRTVADAGPVFQWRTDDVACAIAAVYVVVATGALLASRLGATPLGQTEPIVELTAVHYTYAGAAALTLAAATRNRWAVAMTASAPPLVAAGFATSSASFQVGGAIVMTLGVWLTATLELRGAMDGSIDPLRRVLLATSGLAAWAPMVLAVAWAAGQHWSIPILSIPDMARTHGAANALGFVLCGLVARSLADRSVSPA